MELSEKIRKKMVSAMADFHMIEAGDRVMVAVSGGKDSTAMLLLLRDIQAKAPFDFSIHPVILDQKQPGFSVEQFDQFLASEGFKLDIITEDTYSIVLDKVSGGKSFCGLCSRLRRGILYNYAEAKGYSKIALGHHREDLNETLLLNIFFNGRVASMPPKLQSDDGRNTVIRPMAYVPEAWLIELQEGLNFPVIPCNLCGSQDNLQRSQMKAMLSSLYDRHANIGSSMLNALANVRPSQLMDRDLWDFEKL